MAGKEYQSHHLTLLDGELIVDEDRDSGKHSYRYLAYDIMALNSSPLVDRPWKVRGRRVFSWSVDLRPTALGRKDQLESRAQGRATRGRCMREAGCGLQLLSC